MKVRRVCFVVFFMSILTLYLPLLVFAEDGVKDVPGQANVTVKIEDPETKRVMEWDIPMRDLKLHRETQVKAGDDKDEAIISQYADVDLTPYIKESLEKGTVSGYSTLKDNITITTGLTYSTKVSNNTVRLYNVFGSTTNKGNYYASNRKVYYSNPGAYGTKTFTPSKNPWDVSVNSTAGQYISSLPPFSTLQCRVNISGMTAYRTIYVTFKLEL